MPSGPRATRRQHDWIDARSLALGHAIGEHLRRDPSLRARAVAWVVAQEQAAVARNDQRYLPVLQEWHTILAEASLEDLVFLVGEDPSERATRLRQSTPFVGILPPEERDAIFRRFEAM